MEKEGHREIQFHPNGTTKQLNIVDEGADGFINPDRGQSKICPTQAQDGQTQQQGQQPCGQASGGHR